MALHGCSKHLPVGHCILGTNFVKIEFKVASNFGQEEHINKVQVRKVVPKKLMSREKAHESWIFSVHIVLMVMAIDGYCHTSKIPVQSLTKQSKQKQSCWTLVPLEVEESGMLLWTEIPASRLEIEELAGTEVDGQTDAEMHDLDDLGPFWNAELRFKSFTVVIRGLEANSSYTWRIAVANEVGWSCEKSEPFQSHTIYRPAAPKLMEAQRGAFELRVFWDQPDPLGGPINAWEAQVCESSVFSTWSAAKDFVLLRQPQQNPAEGQETQETADSPAFIVWEATFGCLKAGMEHQLRLRTGNVAGWSEWSEPLKSSTCGPPIISKCTVMQVPSSRDTGDWIVDIFLKDNPCRAFLCAVDFECDLCSGDSKSRVRYQTVARHEKYGNWRAHFPRLANLGLHNAQRATASVAACNAAGWSKVSTVSYQNESKEEQLLASLFY